MQLTANMRCRLKGKISPNRSPRSANRPLGVRGTIKATNKYEGNKAEVYEGVALTALLKQAGVPQGAQVRGAGMAYLYLGREMGGFLLVHRLPSFPEELGRIHRITRAASVRIEFAAMPWKCW